MGVQDELYYTVHVSTLTELGFNQQERAKTILYTRCMHILHISLMVHTCIHLFYCKFTIHSNVSSLYIHTLSLPEDKGSRLSQETTLKIKALPATHPSGSIYRGVIKTACNAMCTQESNKRPYKHRGFHPPVCAQRVCPWGEWAG